MMRQNKINYKTWTISLFMLKFSKLISTNSSWFSKKIIFSIDWKKKYEKNLMRWQICFKRAKRSPRWRNALKICNLLKTIKEIKFTTIKIFKIKVILIRAKDTDNCVENVKEHTKQQNQFNNKNCCNKIIHLFLRIADEMNNDLKNDRNCYNCEKKKHIAKNCLEFKQNNFQINVIRNFWQNIQQSE